MSNLDKDIHMLKSYAGMTHKLTDNQGRPKLDQAIENVLSELEELRKYDIRKIELKNGEIEKAPSFTKEQLKYMNLGIALYETIEKSELELWKKIADLMARQINNYDAQLVINKFRSKEDVLNWAKGVINNDK